MDYGIRGRVAVVTGADSGIGLATTKMLVAEGVRVAMSDQYPASLEAAATTLRDVGEVFPIAADLNSTEQAQALRRAVVDKLGAPSIIVNAAGITGATGPFHEVDETGWISTLDTDLMGAVRLLQAFIPDMRGEGWGRIVLIASENARQPYPDELPYDAAKAAILNLAKGLSKTYASEGILVNTVSPAFIATPMTDAMMDKRARQKGGSREQAIESFLREQRPTLALRRRGEADEVAAAIVFLCSAQASFITGSDLRVDGGSVASI